MAFTCQLEYTEQISEKLFPFYLQLYDAVNLFLEGSAESKPEYKKLVEQAMYELKHMKKLSEDKGERGK